MKRGMAPVEAGTPAATPAPALLAKVRGSLARDRGLPIGTRLMKGARYLASSALAPVRFRACDRVGARPRAIGRPRIENRGRIEIGDDVILNSSFATTELLTDEDGTIELGHRVAINFGTSIAARTLVRIGDGVSVGPYCIIADSDRLRDDVAVTDDGTELSGTIVIGDGVWLATRVTVRPGARIGAGSVITAGSVVSGEIPAGVVAGGIPARVLRPVTPGSGVAYESSAVGDDGRLGESSLAAVARDASAQAVRSSKHDSWRMSGVVLADFTTGDLAVRLRDEAEEPAMMVVASPYGHVAQSLLRPPDEGASDFAIVWTLPNLVSPAFQRVEACEPADDSELLADVDAFCEILLGAATAYRVVAVATWTLPPNHRGLGMIDARPGGLAWALSVMNRRLMERLHLAPNLFVLDAARWIGNAGPGGTSAKAWYLGKVAFHGDALGEAARDIKAAVRGVAGQSRKLLVVDLDDTLWGGIVGDVGWEQLQLGGHDAQGEAFVDFQRGLKQLTRRGVVLGIASKNTESVALEAIRHHPEMVLTTDDFVGWRIDWNDKAANIASLATELNIGLQSVVFIDDNPVERSRVRDALPEVLVPEWPEDKLLYPSALQGLRCFDAPAVTREDSERTGQYSAHRQREAAKLHVGSMDEWLAGLGIRVRVEPLGPSNVTRAAQLLNKTNQMNLTTRRLTAPELASWASEDARALWVVSVSDRFGDSGLTGILGLEAEAEHCRVTDFVLSCRVMGRRVEEAMAHVAVEWARERSIPQVEAKIVPTKKNRPCHDFWRASQFASNGETGFAWNVAERYGCPECISLEWVR